MYKCIAAGIIGFFLSAVVCAINGIYQYDFGVSDLFLGGLFAAITWGWGGDDGVYEQLKELALRRGTK